MGLQASGLRGVLLSQVHLPRTHLDASHQVRPRRSHSRGEKMTHWLVEWCILGWRRARGAAWPSGRADTAGEVCDSEECPCAISSHLAAGEVCDSEEWPCAISSYLAAEEVCYTSTVSSLCPRVRSQSPKEVATKRRKGMVYWCSCSLEQLLWKSRCT